MNHSNGLMADRWSTPARLQHHGDRLRSNCLGQLELSAAGSHAIGARDITLRRTRCGSLKSNYRRANKGLAPRAIVASITTLSIWRRTTVARLGTFNN